jgi:hypothetical protein
MLTVLKRSSWTFFIKAVIPTGKVEWSLRESFELVQAREDCSDGEETYSPVGIVSEPPPPPPPIQPPSKPCSFSNPSTERDKEKEEDLSEGDEFFNDEKRS